MHARWWGLLAGALLAMPAQAQGPVGAGPADVHVVKRADGAWQLQVDGRAFHVDGAGSTGAHLRALAAAGGNSVRTWDANDPAATRALLDQAQALGLKVTLGLEVARERHGFDYGDAGAVAAQQARLRQQVLAYRDHPALLMWSVGNELNLHARDARVWDAVEQLTGMIHQLDPHHPVMTTLAGFDAGTVAQLARRAPSLDLVGIQLYGELEALPAMLRAAGWDRPYLVTEWGPTGHWESPLTAWQDPIEDDSTRKAQLLQQRYRAVIAADPRQCLGSYVFLWGHKQERTGTWYGLFLDSGESTAGVDAMQQLWTGRWPANRAPAIGPLTLDGQAAARSVTLAPGQAVLAAARAEDPDGDALAWQWVVRQESTATSSGGDAEAVPAQVAAAFVAQGAGRVRFQAPAQPGHYRLFATVRDGQGHAGVANIPFRVQAP